MVDLWERWENNQLTHECVYGRSWGVCDGESIDWLSQIRAPFIIERDLWFSHESIRPKRKVPVWISACLLVTFFRSIIPQPILSDSFSLSSHVTSCSGYPLSHPLPFPTPFQPCRFRLNCACVISKRQHRVFRPGNMMLCFLLTRHVNLLLITSRPFAPRREVWSYSIHNSKKERFFAASIGALRLYMYVKTWQL